MNAVLDEALWYVDHGIYVNAIKPNTKALVNSGPVLGGAVCDATQARDLFDGEKYNLGIVPGAQSGDVWVLDLDIKHGMRGREALAKFAGKYGELPKTRQETTGSGGQHFYFRNPQVPNAKVAIDGIRGLELFGQPHNVVAAPSIVDGNRYTLTNRCEIAELPKDLLDALLSFQVTKSEIGQPKTERNTGMYAEACRLRRYNTPEGEAWDKLLALNSLLCTPPLDERELSKLFKSAWNREPGYFLTELGNCERLRDKHGDDLRYVRESKRWLIWTGYRWVEDTTRRTEQMMADVVREMHVRAVMMPQSDARKAEIAWAKKSEMRNTIVNSLNLVPSPANILKQADLDADAWLLSTPNAIIDLRTGLVIPADRKQLITKCAGVEYDPGATCPTFLAFMQQILPSAPVREFVKRYFGYSLTGDTREQCMAICWGTGSNGKSTLLELMLGLLHDYSFQAAPSTWLKRDGGINNDIATLAGKRLVISTEFEAGAHVASSLLKSATGSETMSARFLYGEFFNFVPAFKIVFGTNHKPVIDGGSLATKRRIRLIEFNTTIPDDQCDKTLPGRLKAEMPGILNWLIEGCLAWQRDGLGYPDEIRAATDSYARANDPITLWTADCCEIGEAFQMQGTTLYASYRPWCERNGDRPKSYADFRQALLEHGYKVVRTKKERVIGGLRLTAEATSSTHEY